MGEMILNKDEKRTIIDYCYEAINNQAHKQLKHNMSHALGSEIVMIRAELSKQRVLKELELLGRPHGWSREDMLRVLNGANQTGASGDQSSNDDVRSNRPEESEPGS